MHCLVLHLLQLHGRSDTPGPEFCPRIENINSDLSEILVASSTEISVTVMVKHLQVSVVVDELAVAELALKVTEDSRQCTMICKCLSCI